jgi:hypothetical protein
MTRVRSVPETARHNQVDLGLNVKIGFPPDLVSLFADVPDPHSDGVSPRQFRWIWSEDAEGFVGFRLLFAAPEAPCGRRKDHRHPVMGRRQELVVNSCLTENSAL